MNDARLNLVGQSLMVSFAGDKATPEVLDLLTATRPCGVLLFGRNITTPAALRALIAALQARAAALGLPPLLVAIDQEGGIVSRLPAPFVTVPSPMAQAATGDPDAAYRCALITGQQLRAFGINTNFAPSLDINCNPANPVIGTRSYGHNPREVIAFGLAALRGYHDARVIATAKHFPGHGDTRIDSHLGLPVVTHDLARLTDLELAPFVAAIKGDVPAIMTAHIVFDALDALPATLSRPILTDLLRDELGFPGVVFTDALEMQAIAESYGPVEAALLSKAAGADVLLPLGTAVDQIAVAQALADAIGSGRIPQVAFEATAQRLDALRMAYGISATLPLLTEPNPDHAAAALDVARRSITLLCGEDFLPLAGDTRLALIDCVLPRFSLVEEALERAELIRDLARAAFPQTTSLTLTPPLIDHDVAQAVALAARSDAVLLLTRNASLIEPQAELARSMAATNTPLIHAVVRNPYDATLVPGSAATLLTYGDPGVSLRALVEVLAGRVVACGVPPVDLSMSVGGAEA